MQFFQFPAGIQKQALFRTDPDSSLLDGTDGTLWVGGMSGLYLFDKQTGELSQHPLAKKHKKLENVLIYTLFRDSKGRIWIGTEESLFLYAGGKLEEPIQIS